MDGDCENDGNIQNGKSQAELIINVNNLQKMEAANH